MNFKQAKILLENHGYQLVKEAIDHDAWLINSYERSIGGYGPDSDDMIEYAEEHSELPNQKWLDENLESFKEKIPGLLSIKTEEYKEPEIDGDNVIFNNKIIFTVEFATAEDAENDDLLDEYDEKIGLICESDIWKDVEPYERYSADADEPRNLAYFEYILTEKTAGFYVYDPD